MAIPSLALAEKITIATGNFPPLYIESKTATNYPGVVPLIVQEAFATQNYHVNYQFVPWARANYYTRSNDVEGSCCWYEQDERKVHALYSDSVFFYTYSFFYLKTTLFDWRSIQDLEGFSIGGTLSYTYTAGFTEAEKEGSINVKRSNSDLQNLKKLLSGRIDVFPVNTDVAYYLLKKHFPPESVELVTHHSRPLVNSHVHLLFSKQRKGSQQLLKLFNKGLREIKSNGRYQEIVDAYNREK